MSYYNPSERELQKRKDDLIRSIDSHLKQNPKLNLNQYSLDIRQEKVKTNHDVEMLIYKATKKFLDPPTEVIITPRQNKSVVEEVLITTLKKGSVKLERIETTLPDGRVFNQPELALVQCRGIKVSVE